MRSSRIARVFAVLTLSLGFASLANAQATRTWVSGVGDDANPCSRTAPCKTFAGAISKTATGGEINVLDPGGFGGVTITKSITISSEGFEAGVLVSGTNGIVINAPSTAFIVLRGLDIEGLGTGLRGISFLAGGSLHVENCTINKFTTAGISFTPNTAALLHVRNTIIRGVTSATNAPGILIKPSVAGVLAQAQLDQVRLDHNAIGLRVEQNSNVSISNSNVANNTLHGIFATSTAASALIMVNATTVSGNVNGIRADLANSIVRLGGSTVTGNGAGINLTNAAQLISFGNNIIGGNTGGEPPMAGFSTTTLK